MFDSGKRSAEYNRVCVGISVESGMRCVTSTSNSRRVLLAVVEDVAEGKDEGYEAYLSNKLERD
jgi:hypothetical protein